MAYLNKQPRGDQGEAAVLSIKSVMVCIERKVVQEEEPQPVAFAYGRVAANRIVLIGYPHNKDNIEGGGRVIEELGHDGLHADQRQDHCEQRGSWKCHRHIELDHLKQINYSYFNELFS
jgi:hypothetical protein